jgi:chemotaxis protein CheX
MKAEYLNPFLKSVVQIVESTAGETPQRGKVYLRGKYPFESADVAIIVGITGVLTGQVILSMTIDAAKGIAARMLMEDEVPELDEYAQSALAEMANMITANATIGLADAGFNCDITPPSVITGSRIEISCQEGIQTLVIPLELTMGKLDVNLSMIETAMFAGVKKKVRGDAAVEQKA